jgi:hypothetical protein
MWANGGKNAGFAADNPTVIRTTVPENIATIAMDFPGSAPKIPKQFVSLIAGGGSPGSLNSLRGKNRGFRHRL